MIRYANKDDIEIISKYDEHISIEELENVIKMKRLIVMFNEDKFIGWLRFNLFWDNTPFCTMLYIDEDSRNKGHDSDLYSSGIDLCKYESSGCSKTGIAAGLYL